MKAIIEEEKLESRVYKNEAGGDGDENEAEVEGDGDSCTEVESSEIGDDLGDGNPEFSETEDGEKLKQNSASLDEKQRSSNHAHQVLDKMPKTATMTKTKGNFSVSISDSFLSCSQSSFVNVVDNLAPGKCSVDEINQPSSEVEDMVSDKMPRPILIAEGNSGKPFVPSSSKPFSPCVGFAVNDLNPDRMLGNGRKQVGEKGDFPNPAHKMKQLKQKMQDEVSKAIIATNGAPLSVSEHKAIVLQIKAEAAQAHAEMLESRGVVTNGMLLVFHIK
ncbi:hypothetical protein U1Q18_046629 [Sarracenia purpurea var. burkii]